VGLSACARVRPLAPELALGILDGAERAEALEHIQHCPSCLALVEEFSQVSDSLLLLAPSAEPPRSLATGVLSRMGASPPGPRRRRLLAAAAGLVAALAAGAGAWLGASPGPRAAPAASPAPSTRSAALLGPGGRPVGMVLAHPGRPGWVYMTVDDPPASEWVTCYLQTASGRRVRLGSFDVYEGRGSWGAPAPVPAASLRGAVLVGPGDHQLATARF